MRKGDTFPLLLMLGFLALCVYGMIVDLSKTPEQKAAEAQRSADVEYHNKQVAKMHPDDFRKLIAEAVEQGIRAAKEQEVSHDH